MAIDFINRGIVSAGRGESTVGLGAYLCRSVWRNPLTEQLHDFSRQAADLLSVDVLLPPDADRSLTSPYALASAMERAELVIDRKRKTLRFRTNAQLAQHVILALPKELSERQRHELAREWAKTQYVDQGAGVLLAIHQADDPETGNHHAHLLVTTRVVGPEGFSKTKARHLNPLFSRGTGHTKAKLHKEDLPGQWRAFQNDFFRRHDIPLSVDPGFLVRGHHRGKSRFLRQSDLAADDEAARAEAQRRIRHVPDLLAFATRNSATFSRQSLVTILRKHGIPAAEIRGLCDQALADPEALPLLDRVSGRKNQLFTTRTVRAQEMRILALADTLAGRQPGARQGVRLAARGRQIAIDLGLTAEQNTAMLHCITGGDLTLLRGVAGAGKSYTVKGIREALETCGYRIVGLAPTNKVVCTMAVDGFGYTATLHLEDLRQENPRPPNLPWDSRTAVIVDEAGMVDAEMLEKLLIRAAAAGAKVVLVGDQAQLASVSRGGMLGVLKERLGAAEIKEIRRQELDWAKAASLEFSEGNIAAGLAAYDERGYVHWDDDLSGAMEALVRQWRQDYQQAPDTDRFVYAATNVTAFDLNERLQAARWEGLDKVFLPFKSHLGPVDLTVGDRIQLHKNVRKDGIFNGTVGTILSVAPDRISLRTDAGATVAFDPRSVPEFSLGYAGTVYRGQGQTLPQTYAIYDSKFAWTKRTTYVAMTRHKQAVRLYVPRDLAPDLDTLGRQMSRGEEGDPSICYATTEEFQATGAATSVPPANADTAIALPGYPGTKSLAPLSKIAIVPTDPGPIAAEPVPIKPTPTRPIAVPLSPLSIVTAVSGPGGTDRGRSDVTSRRITDLPALPFRATLNGRVCDFDLGLAADRQELRTALAGEPMNSVIATYHLIKKVESTRVDARHHLEHLRGCITSDSLNRAFVPKEKRVWRYCLRGVRFDPQNIFDHEALCPRKREIDIRSLIQPLYDVDQKVRWNLGERLKNFVVEALRNIDLSLGNASIRARGNEELQLAIINTRTWLYDVTYERGVDLHPRITAELGRRATPDEYRDHYLPLAREAERAAGLAAGPILAQHAGDPEKVIFFRTEHYDYKKGRLLERLYEARLIGLIALEQGVYDGASERFHMMAPGNHNAIYRDQMEAAAVEKARLQRQLAAFKAAPAEAIRSAAAIDFLPANISAKDVVPPKRFLAEAATGFRVPDPATRKLEDILRQHLWRPVKNHSAPSASPSQLPRVQPVEQPSHQRKSPTRSTGPERA